MQPQRDSGFQRLLELAHDSAQALREAGVPPCSPVSSVRGWLVIERLDVTDVTHVAGEGSDPQFAVAHFEQIWLTVDGRLQTGLRECTADLCAPGFDGATESDTTRGGAAIVSAQDIGARWDGPYGATSRWIDRVERTVQDRPDGPREDPKSASRRRLRRTTGQLLERRRRDATDPAPAGLVATRAHVKRWHVAVGLTTALIVFVFSDFTAAFSLLLWATPLLLLAIAAIAVYVGFARFGTLGVAFLAGAAVSVVVLWFGYVVVVDLWFYDDPHPCAAFVEHLPKGKEFCTAPRTGAEQWDPPLWHFGR